MYFEKCISIDDYTETTNAHAQYFYFSLTLEQDKKKEQNSIQPQEIDHQNHYPYFINLIKHDHTKPKLTILYHIKQMNTQDLNLVNFGHVSHKRTQ